MCGTGNNEDPPGTCIDDCLQSCRDFCEDSYCGPGSSWGLNTYQCNPALQTPYSELPECCNYGLWSESIDNEHAAGCSLGEGLGAIATRYCAQGLSGTCDTTQGAMMVAHPEGQGGWCSTSCT